MIASRVLRCRPALLAVSITRRTLSAAHRVLPVPPSAVAAVRRDVCLPLAWQHSTAHPSTTAARGTATSPGPMAPLEFDLVEVHNPASHNFILGQSHFIKTVEDLAEVMASAGGGAKWGLAFCEASGDPDDANMPGRKVRFDGNDEQMTDLAKRNALAIGAGHSFIIFMEGMFPVSVLNAIKAVPEVCRIYCATANPTAVVVAKSGPDRKGIMGVLDGLCPVDFETDSDKEKRKAFLRMIGYKR